MSPHGEADTTQCLESPKELQISNSPVNSAFPFRETLGQQLGVPSKTAPLKSLDFLKPNLTVAHLNKRARFI